MRHVGWLALLCGAAWPLAAQAPVGVIRGRVTDAASGIGLAGAEIIVIGRDTARLTANEHGEWVLPLPSTGTYRVRVRSPGFRMAEDSVVIRGDVVAEQHMALTPLALPLDAVVVTAARREQKLKDVVVTTEIVSRQDIERSGASDLAAVLIEQTGIELAGGHPAGSGAMLQGIGSERVLVLLDGQPVVGRIAGEFDVSRIPASVVERVEIVKGPQSTLYGSDAMGGVINVITRSPENDGFGLSSTFTAGTQARLDGSAGADFGRGPLAARIDVGRRSIEATPGRSQTAGALAMRTDAATKLVWRPAEMTSLEAGVLALDERQRWRSGSVYTFADNVQWSGRLSVRKSRTTALVYASVFDHLSRGSSEPLPIAGDTGQRQVQRLFQAELTYNGRLGPHALDIGTQLRRDDTRSVRIPGGRRSLTTIEPLAQLELAATDNLSLTGGLRVSRSSRWGTHTTPRVALRYRPSSAVTLRASTGTGFRAPDFRELYMFFVNQSVGYSVRGNPDLRPERSNNVSVGAEVAHDVAFVRAQLFWNEFRDFIETRPISGPGEPPVYLYENVDDGRTRGAELEGGMSLPRLRMEAALSVLDTRENDTGRPLLGRPSISGRLTALHSMSVGLRMNTSAVFTGRTPMQRDAAGAITSWRTAFLRFDVRVSRRLAKDVEVTLGTDNVFDTRPAQWAGLTRRHVYTALTWNMGQR